MKAIRAALEGRLATWAATQSLTVAYENVPFNPPSGAYLRAFLLPAETHSDDLAGSHRAYRGIWQVNVVAPIGKGAGAALTIAEAIATLFPVNQSTLLAAGVHITHPVTIGAAIQDSERYTVPCWCRYRMDSV